MAKDFLSHKENSSSTNPEKDPCNSMYFISQNNPKPWLLTGNAAADMAQPAPCNNNQDYIETKKSKEINVHYCFYVALSEDKHDTPG